MARAIRSNAAGRGGTYRQVERSKQIAIYEGPKAGMFEVVIKMNTNIEELDLALAELAKATKLYQDCDAQNRWRQYRIQMQAWEARVAKLGKIAKQS